MTPPRIGRLRRRVVIEAPVSTPDGAGGQSLTWSVVGTGWAMIEARHGRVRREEDQLASALTIDISMRWRGDIGAAMRLKDGPRLYLIEAVLDPDGRRRRLRIIAREERL